MDNLDRAMDSYERRMPSEYDSSPIIVGTAPSSTAEQKYLEGKDIDNRFMWRIPKDSNTFYTSVNPISVKITAEGNFVFAENDKLGLYGNGLNVQEAIGDIGQHIIYFFDYYSSLSEDQLMGDALRLKKLYSTLLLEEHAS